MTRTLFLFVALVTGSAMASGPGHFHFPHHGAPNAKEALREAMDLAAAIQDVVFEGKEPQEVNLLEAAKGLLKGGIDAGRALAEIAKAAERSNLKIIGILEDPEKSLDHGLPAFHAARLLWSMDAADGVLSGLNQSLLQAPPLAPKSRKIYSPELAKKESLEARDSFYNTLRPQIDWLKLAQAAQAQLRSFYETVEKETLRHYHSNRKSLHLYRYKYKAAQKFQSEEEILPAESLKMYRLLELYEKADKKDWFEQSQELLERVKNAYY